MLKITQENRYIIFGYSIRSEKVHYTIDTIVPRYGLTGLEYVYVSQQNQWMTDGDDKTWTS